MTLNESDTTALRHAQMMTVLEEIKALLAELIAIERIIYRMSEVPDDTR